MSCTGSRSACCTGNRSCDCSHVSSGTAHRTWGMRLNVILGSLRRLSLRHSARVACVESKARIRRASHYRIQYRRRKSSPRTQRGVHSEAGVWSHWNWDHRRVVVMLLRLRPRIRLPEPYLMVLDTSSTVRHLGTTVWGSKLLCDLIRASSSS